MTVQVTHSFEYNGEIWRLLVVSQNFSGHMFHQNLPYKHVETAQRAVLVIMSPVE